MPPSAAPTLTPPRSRHGRRAGIEDHTALWAAGPQVDPVRFARVENAKQILRSLAAILAMEQTPTASGEKARHTALTALARMR